MAKRENQLNSINETECVLTFVLQIVEIAFYRFVFSFFILIANHVWSHLHSVHIVQVHAIAYI